MNESKKTPKEDNFVREFPMADLCGLLGGKTDYKKSSCVFLDEANAFDRSVSDEPPKYAIYYAIQMFVGTALTLFSTFFGVTIVPPWWYFNLIVLIMACSFFVFSDWFREGELVESLKRMALLLPIYVVASVVVATTVKFGTPINSTYWFPLTYLTSSAVIATIDALFVASILNVFLLPKAELLQVLE